MGRLRRLRQELEFRALLLQMTPADKRQARLSLREAAVRSRREFTFVGVYCVKLAPIILGVLSAIAFAFQPLVTLEAFKAGLAGAAIWEVGKHIILG